MAGGEPAGVVRAAGGVVWRRRGGTLEVVLVHRAHYDDWSIPKGKVDGDESEEAAAVREVREETRVTTRLGPVLGVVSYVDRLGRRKTVRYWAMTAVEGEAAGDHEVDQAVWLPIGVAGERLTYPRDGAVLDRLAALESAGELA